MRVDDGVMMPRRATKGSAGYDFFAPEDIVLKAGEYTTVNTGVHLTPKDFVGMWMTVPLKFSEVREPNPCFDSRQVILSQWVFVMHPKSGLAFKYGVRLLGGVVDMDYVKEDDEIRAKLTTDVDVTIRKGEKFMQGILQPFGTFLDEIKPTEDRNGGFGSTGA